MAVIPTENSQLQDEEKKLPDTPPPEYDLIGEEVKISLPPSSADIKVALSEHGERDLCLPPDYSVYAIPPEDGGDVRVDEVDPWALPDFQETSLKLSDLDTCGKLRYILVGCVGKFLALTCLLYLFICSLDFLSSGFRLLGGKAAGQAFSDSELLRNPIAGLMIGILATVLVQSSSTSTSITVTMVASGIMDVRPAIPIIMGSNIGTSVTNTIVSMAQSGDKNEFRRAFGGATVHDMFNWLAVLILLPLEVATGYLYHLTSVIVKSYQLQSSSSKKTELLKVLTKPLTKLVIQLDKSIIEKIAAGHSEYASKSLIKEWCGYEEVTEPTNVTSLRNESGLLANYTTVANVTKKIGMDKCHFLFHDTGLSDAIVGFILLAMSLFVLCSCLVLMVKLLHSMLQGRICTIIRKTVNSDFPGKLSWLTGYVAILIGAGMTMLVQSSSIFTSAMTPLVGMGVISLERMYPLTLGSNIGTTVTGLLAALAASGDKLEAALQIALCHLFFNISGITLFYPIPALRKLPIKLAKMMGNTTAEYRWFAIFYLVVAFFVVPGTIFALSMTGTIPFFSVLSPILLMLAFVITVNVMQVKRPTALPKVLKDWEFLPLWMHSLEPLDGAIKRARRGVRRVCPWCCKQKKPDSRGSSPGGSSFSSSSVLDDSPYSSRSASILLNHATSL